MLREYRLSVATGRYLKLSRGSAHPEAARVIRINTRHVAQCILATRSRVRGSLSAPVCATAHNIMHRRYCAACALVTVTSSGTTFLTLARGCSWLHTAACARTHVHAHRALLPFLFLLQHHPFPLPIFTPVLPPYLSLFLLLSLSRPSRSRVGYEQCSGLCKKCITDSGTSESFHRSFTEIT